MPVLPSLNHRQSGVEDYSGDCLADLRHQHRRLNRAPRGEQNRRVAPPLELGVSFRSRSAVDVEAPS